MELESLRSLSNSLDPGDRLVAKGPAAGKRALRDTFAGFHDGCRRRTVIEIPLAG